MIIQLLFSDPLSYLMWAVSILLALSIHEYAHAQAADFLGDRTARELGRLTVNPIRHLDPIGAILLFTVGFGWGKPVPFNLANLRNKRWGPGLIGLAGPASNFLMALIVGFVLRFVSIANPGLVSFFVIFVWLNIILGVFNLLPIFPLDGSHVLFAILHKRSERAKMALLKGGMFSLLIAIFFMIYIGLPFICKPLFDLITGIPLLL